MKTKQTDFLIAGGGPVGLILAIGLAKNGFKVVVAEKQQPDFSQRLEQTQAGFDGRVLALSYGSMQLLESIGLAESLSQKLTKIQKIHVSQKGFLGVTTMSAEELAVPALGYSIQGWDLGQILWQHAAQLENIDLLANTQIESFTQIKSIEHSGASTAGQAYAVTARLHSANTPLEIQCRMLIGADGTDSQVRQGLGIELHTKEYEAFGILSRIESREHPHGLAFERFTQSGPMALLPMHGHFHKAVWVCPKEQKDAILALDDEAFLEAFAERMGERFGGFVSVSQRLAYPLKETSLSRISEGAVLLMGNAAHTQHPVAAQGLNLGIADIAEFLEVFTPNHRPVEMSDLQFVHKLVENYALQRQAHHQKVMGMTDGLIGLFGHASPVVGHLRGLGLMAMQALPFAKKRFAKFAMGKKN